MAKRLLIHIGTGKTGTSTVQGYLKRYSSKLEARGISYPLVPGWDNQGIFSILFRDPDKLQRGIKSRIDEKTIQYKDLYQLCDELMSTACSNFDNIIFSSEFLSSFNAEEVESLSNYFNKQGVSDYSVIAFFREPISFYTSYIQQNIKASSDFIKPADFKPSYKMIDRVWSDCFASDFCAFPLQSEPGKDPVRVVTKTINRFFGVDSKLKPGRAVRTNTSLSAESIEIIRQYRACNFPDSNNIPNVATEAFVNIVQYAESLADFPLSSPILRPEIKSILRSHMSSDIQYYQSLTNGASPPIENHNSNLNNDNYLIDKSEDIFAEFNIDSYNRMIYFIFRILSGENR